MKKAWLIGIIIFIVIIGTLLAVRLIGPENSWICQNGQWVKHGNPSIDKPAVGCIQTEVQSDHALADSYIRNHISELSPNKEVLGGKFYVTSISFPDNGQAFVNYEDGHIALKGIATYQINNGQVKIISFVTEK